MTDKATASIYRYWGKVCSKEEKGPTYHLLLYHCLDVAAVGRTILERQQALLQQLGDLSWKNSELFLNWSTFLLAIHDIGKFADGFQNLKPALLQQLQKRSTQTPYNELHDTLGYRFCQKYVTTVIKTEMYGHECDIIEEDLWDLLEPWFCAVTGHHGRPPKLSTYPMPINTQFPVRIREDALTFVKEIITIFLSGGLTFQLEAYDDLYTTFKHVSWLMAGLAVAADWIGSNRLWFHYCIDSMPLADYWNDVALPQAATAVEESGLSTVGISPVTGMRHIFSDICLPTPLQRLVENVEISTGPQLFIIEEVTGGGKTEAAIILAHRLMAKGLADGLFLALPTMATANAMHKRVQKIYRKLFIENSDPSFILAHSASKMTLDLERKNLIDKGYSNYETSASLDCAAWLADSRKKALLAHVGVGTIDQVLLAILAVRHQSLRLLGLARKVLIVDEVHACDAYVHRLLCALLNFHSAQGSSVVLLSATLPQAMRTQFIKSFAEGAGKKFDSVETNQYPLLTHFSTEDVRELHVAPCIQGSRHVEVRPLHCVDEVDEMLESSLGAGGCACWVRNTVYDALQSYNNWVKKLGEDRVMLFHARFTLYDRLKIEEKVNSHFGLNSQETDRRGALLIATQVVEQSLDLDFDFMTSDLAPIDLLIQRAGRLHRHVRGPRKLPVLGIYMPKLVEEAGSDWFREMFPRAAGVYRHHGQLWLTARWLYEHRGFSMPDDARKMIEWVYGFQSQTEIPEDLQLIEEQAVGEDSAESSLGWLNSLKFSEGYRPTTINWQQDISAPTRLGEPTVTVRLVRLDDNRLVPWAAENTGHDWELSQVSIRQSQIAQEDLSYMPDSVAAARQTMPDAGRHSIVVPMHNSEGTWKGRAINAKGEIVNLTYSSIAGLEMSIGGCE